MIITSAAISECGFYFSTSLSNKHRQWMFCTEPVSLYPVDVLYRTCVTLSCAVKLNTYYLLLALLLFIFIDRGVYDIQRQVLFLIF